MFTKKEEGHVIVTSLVILLVLIIVITSMALLINSEVSFLTHEKGNLKAFYTAEAGLEYACNIINENSMWNSIPDPAELKQTEIDSINNVINNGTLTNITKEQSGNLLTVSSTANSCGIEKTITNSFLISSKSFDYSFVANGQINMVNNATIIGTEDGGDLYSNDVITYKNNFETEKELYENQAIDIVPIIDFNELKNNAYTNIYTELEAADLDLSTIGN